MKNDFQSLETRKNGPLDLATVQELMSFDKATTNSLFVELAVLFETNAPQRVRNMRVSTNHNDLSTVMREAHILKSSAGNLGAILVQSASREIEEMAATRTQGLHPRINTLELQVTQAISELHRIIRGENS